MILLQMFLAVCACFCAFMAGCSHGWDQGYAACLSKEKSK